MLVLSPQTLPSQTAHGEENQWSDSLKTLELRMAEYRKLTAQGASQAQLDEAAQQVATTIRIISSETPSSPPTYYSEPPPVVDIPQSSRAIHQQTDIDSGLSRAPSPRYLEDIDDSEKYDKEHPLKRAGRGVLIVAVAPLALGGMGMYACGMMLQAGGEMCKGFGLLGKRLLVTVRGKPRKSYARTK